MRASILACLSVSLVGCAAKSSSAPPDVPQQAPAAESPRWTTAKDPTCSKTAPRGEPDACPPSTPPAEEDLKPPPKADVPVAVAADNVAVALEAAEKARPKPPERESSGLFAPIGEGGEGFGMVGILGSGPGTGSAFGVGSGLGSGLGGGGAGIVGGGGLGLGGVAGLGTAGPSVRVLAVTGGPKDVPAATLRRVAMSSVGAARRCVEDAKAAKSRVPDKVNVAVTVTKDGHVAKASSGLAKPLGPCLDAAFSRLAFPNAASGWTGFVQLKLSTGP